MWGSPKQCDSGPRKSDLADTVGVALVPSILPRPRAKPGTVNRLRSSLYGSRAAQLKHNTCLLYTSLAAYPKDFERDCALAAAEGVDAMFAPEAGEMYAGDHATFVKDVYKRQ